MAEDPAFHRHLGWAWGDGLLLSSIQSERKKKNEIAAEWGEFEQAAAKLDTEQMKEALGRLAQKLPGDQVVKRRQESLERGDADDNDQIMIYYWMRKDFNDRRYEQAGNEARKRIKTNPEDWLARCILADVALRNKKEAEAKRNSMPCRLPRPRAAICLS